MQISVDVFNEHFAIMYRSNRSFNIPPPDIPRAFDTFAVPGRWEFDYRSLPGGGEFDSYALGVGNLNCTLDFRVKSLVWRAIMGDVVLEDFVENIVPLWPIDYEVRACFVPYLNLFEF